MSSYRRHPAEVTSDRLLDAVERWPDKFDGGERDMIGVIRNRLNQIADEAESANDWRKHRGQRTG